MTLEMLGNKDNSLRRGNRQKSPEKIRSMGVRGEERLKGEGEGRRGGRKRT